MAFSATLPRSKTTPATTETAIPRPYLNPYLAGVGIGVVLLLAFVIMGRGLGASGAFSSVVASGLRATGAAEAQPFIAEYSTPPWRDWLVIEIAGVIIGGIVSAWSARRLIWRMERGEHIGGRSRLALAFTGGLAMGFGAKLARGCTSGLGLTGGALLSVGSWIFVLAAFAAAFAAAPLLRRAWR
jgi:uncharacterized membrane protein YedE/YeeE